MAYGQNALICDALKPLPIFNMAPGIWHVLCQGIMYVSFCFGVCRYCEGGTDMNNYTQLGSQKGLSKSNVCKHCE